MNILPKKRWHVRTKDNISRVRRDESKAKEEELQLSKRIQLAEKEARINTLRQKATISIADFDIIDIQSNPNKYEHFNFFSDLEAGIVKTSTINEEHGKEKLDEQQKYEKQIGLLTFLGQDTNEALKQKSWYEIPPNELPTCSMNKERDEKIKNSNDPINVLKKISSKEVHYSIKKIQKPNPSLDEKKSKKRNNSKEKVNRKSDKYKELEKIDYIKKLREERLKREILEKHKQDILLGKLQGLPYAGKSKATKKNYVKQKYHSQFNPQIAKQNY